MTCRFLLAIVFRTWGLDCINLSFASKEFVCARSTALAHDLDSNGISVLSIGVDTTLCTRVHWRFFGVFCYSGGTRSSPPPAFSKTLWCRSQNQFEKDRTGSCRSQILWLTYQWRWNTPAYRKTWRNQKLPKTGHCQRPEIFSGCSKFLQGCNSKLCHHCGSPAQALARQEASFRTFGF